MGCQVEPGTLYHPDNRLQLTHMYPPRGTPRPQLLAPKGTLPKPQPKQLQIKGSEAELALSSKAPNPVSAGPALS